MHKKLKSNIKPNKEKPKLVLIIICLHKNKTDMLTRNKFSSYFTFKYKN